MKNYLQRIITAAIAIPIILFICMQGGWFFFIFIALASAFALKEFYSLVQTKGAKPMVTLGVISGVFVNCSFYVTKLHIMIAGLLGVSGVPFPTSAQFLLITLLISIAVFGLVELFRNNGSAILNLSTTIMGVLYIPLFFGAFIGIRELFIPLDFPMMRFFPNPNFETSVLNIETAYRWGGVTVISIFAIIWICDSAAYYGGMLTGKHKLFPRVSPNKSWEGAMFGFIFAIGTAVAAKALVLPYLNYGEAIVIGIIVGTIGQMGDLVESLIKRDAGVKDSSNLIPGHGGVLDRFDSLLFVAPIVYLYLDFIVFG
ncbi:MAG: phosphatidate cytidylyltransferase [Bacteroidota bacterium]